MTQTTAHAPVYTWQAAAAQLGISPGYLRLLSERGIATPSVPLVSNRDGQRVFTRDDLARVAAAIGRELPKEAA